MFKLFEIWLLILEYIWYTIIFEEEKLDLNTQIIANRKAESMTNNSFLLTLIIFY